MSEPFMAEIRVFSFNFVPKGWARCEGQLLAINQNQALFSILGTVYGGNGITNFALPDLRGRTPMHWGSSISHGEQGGADTVSLNALQAPCSVLSDHPPTTAHPHMRWPAQGGAYAGQTGSVSLVGGGQAHENRSPYIALTYAIALVGIYPARD